MYNYEFVLSAEFIHFIAGQKETEADMLRSILAQLEFAYIVRDFDGVPFRSHLHCLEVHPETGTVFCKHEDAGHVLTVIIMTPVSNFSAT